MNGQTGPLEPLPSGLSDEIEELLLAGVLQGPDRLGILARLDGYDILKRIGAGGMGVVVSAQEKGAIDKVAIKILLPLRARDPEHKRRFLQEVQYMQNLSK